MSKIAQYKYKVRDKQGNLFKGLIEADDESAALKQLRNRDYYPISVEEAREQKDLNEFFQRFKKVSTYDLVLFSRQFATMIDSGLSMVRTLKILSSQTENPKLREAIVSLREKVESGTALSTAMEEEDVFPKLFVSMIRAGESGGVLSGVLNEMAGHYERANELKQEVKSAMTYPIVVILISIVVVVGLIAFVLPGFTQIFGDIGGELPVVTRALLALGDFMRAYWYVFPLLGLAGFLGIKYYYATDEGEKAIDALLLKIPMFGDLIRKSSVSRFSQTMSVLISSGVSILESFELTAEIVENRVISDVIKESRKSISGGESIAAPLERTEVFPPMVLQMIKVGEETGTIDEMLGKVANFYEDEVRYAVDGLVSMIEPVTIAVLGIVVGLILYSVMGPMFEMIGQV